MKEYYQISEIAKLYGIGIDSLRYYEKLGVISPKRGENRYRYYTLQDIYKLNILQDLRRLGFSMQQIKAYFDNQNLNNTMTLLTSEQELLSRQIIRLTESRLALEQQLQKIKTAAAQPVGEITIENQPERRCLRLRAKLTRDEEIDFIINRLQHSHEDQIHHLGNLTIGAIISIPDYRAGHYGVFNAVFFIMEQTPASYDFSLRAGTYLTCRYRGNYDQSPLTIKKLLAYAEDHQLKIDGEPFELYHLDNRYTLQSEEFLTEIQLPISYPE
ncbi:MAG: MerR family transcriptional regulator [Erysipelotrichaceae bacterium]|nr:MerR family transcriptional regulator [Erysipelotrichaceae bacterium]